MKVLSTIVATFAMIFLFGFMAHLLVERSAKPVTISVPEMELSRSRISPVAEPLSSDLGKEKKAEPVSSLPPAVETSQGNRRKTTDDVLIEKKARFVIKKYGSIIKEAAVTYDLDWREVTAFVVIESVGDPRARSGSGAEGLMQLKRGAAKDVGVKNRLDPRENVFGGARYLSILKKQGYQSVGERALAYHDGAKGAGKFLASGKSPREHFHVPRILHAYRIIRGIEPV